MRRSSQDWPSLLREFSESGLSQKLFCEQKRVSLSSFGYWLKKSRGNGSGDNGRTRNFIELDLAGEPAADRTLVNDGEVIVELPLGVVLRIRGGRR